MDAVYLEIREIARQIVARYPRPDFYGDHPSEVMDSHRFYQSDAAVARLRNDMAGCLDDDFGHGMGHVEKVAIDAGTLAIIESRLVGHEEEMVRRNLLMAHCAGLLHDICRKEKSHAERGAETAYDILQTYPLVPEEITFVCSAIRNHEAFTSLEQLPAHQAHMISDCLYDADKFRWGPDNFTDTVWDMISFHNPPLSQFVKYYPKGMQGIEKIKATFRTATGKKYGPQFIDLATIGHGLQSLDPGLAQFCLAERNRELVGQRPSIHHAPPETTTTAPPPGGGVETGLGGTSGADESPLPFLAATAIGSLPDLDVFIAKGDPVLDMVLHRAETHGVTRRAVQLSALRALSVMAPGSWSAPPHASSSRAISVTVAEPSDQRPAALSVAFDEAMAFQGLSVDATVAGCHQPFQVARDQVDFQVDPSTRLQAAQRGDFPSARAPLETRKNDDLSIVQGAQIHVYLCIGIFRAVEVQELLAALRKMRGEVVYSFASRDATRAAEAASGATTAARSSCWPGREAPPPGGAEDAPAGALWPELRRTASRPVQAAGRDFRRPSLTVRKAASSSADRACRSPLDTRSRRGVSSPSRNAAVDETGGYHGRFWRPECQTSQRG